MDIMSLLAIVGFFVSLRVAINVFYYLYQINKTNETLYKQFGGESSWAVITGASSGIGLELAKELARKGFKTLLIARREDELKLACGEIKSKFGLESSYMCEDLVAIGGDVVQVRNFVDRVKKEINQEDLGIFVFNAGFALLARHFSDISLEQNLRLLQIGSLNTLATLQTMIPDMITRKKETLVICMGALNTNFSVPQLSLSGANKCFLRSFFKSINYEYEGKLRAVVAHPIAVNTGILKIAFFDHPIMKASGINFILSSEEFCHNLVRDIEAGMLETCGSWKHEFLVDSLLFFKFFLSETVVAKTFLWFGPSIAKWLGKDVDARPIEVKLRQ